MQLKPEDQIASALATTYTDLPEERKGELLAVIRATHPGRLNKLHAIFSLPPPQGLSEPERAFYDAIVDVSGNEPVMEVGMTQEELAQHAVLDTTSPDYLMQMEQSYRDLLKVKRAKVDEAQADLEALKQKMTDLAALTGNLVAPVNGKPVRKAFTPGATASPATDGSAQ